MPGIADELAHPAQRLALDVARRLGADREVDVVAGGEQIADHADLQPGAADEAEPARTGLGEALVEHPRRVLEHVVGGRGALRQARARTARASSSSIGGWPSRAWSKLVHASAISRPAWARTSLRGASRASELTRAACQGVLAAPLISWKHGQVPPIPPFRAALDALVPYQPGRPVELVQRELGLTGPCVKLASNEGQYGPFPAALEAIAARRSPRATATPTAAATRCATRSPSTTGSTLEQIVVGNGADASAQLPLARDARARGRGRVLLAVVPRYPINAAKMGAVSVTRAARGQRLRPRRARRRRRAAHEDRLRHEPEQPDRRHGRRATRSTRFLDGLPEHVLPVIDEAYHEYVDDPDYPDGCASTSLAGPPRGRAAHVLEDLRPRRAARRLGRDARWTSPRRCTRSRTPST